MGLFGKNKEGGMLAAIRSPEQDYLVWKWRPSDAPAGTTMRENSIRWGSSLRVRDGEVAVFVYANNGEQQDFIEGPFDQVLKTANLPVLSNILGMAYGGDSPFQASVYFINRAGTQTLPFRLPWFEVAESQPNLGNFTVPCTVQGTVYFAIDDYRAFIKMNRLTDFDTARLREKILPILESRLKGVVTNIGTAFNIPLVQLERSIDTVREEATKRLGQMFEEMFGTKVRSVEISSIELNRDSEGYKQLKAITADQVAATEMVKGDVQRQNLQDMQALNMENLSESARIQREQMAFAQQMQTKSANINVLAIEKQAEVLRAAGESLGTAGQVGGGVGGGGGFNPAGVMMGIGLGGIMTNQMGAMMAGMGTPGMGMPGMPGAPGMPPGAPPAPPPMAGMPSGGAPPVVQYFMSAGGAQYGPYTMDHLRGYAQSGQLTAAHLVWRDGLPAWMPAGQVPDLMPLFGAAAAPPPPPPPPPPPANGPPAPPTPPPPAAP